MHKEGFENVPFPDATYSATLEWSLCHCFTPFHFGKFHLVKADCRSSKWLPCVRGEVPGGSALRLYGMFRKSYKQQRERFLVDKKKERIVFCLGFFKLSPFQGPSALTGGKPYVQTSLMAPLPFEASARYSFLLACFPSGHLLTFAHDY